MGIENDRAVQVMPLQIVLPEHQNCIPGSLAQNVCAGNIH
jgi:hypothetical protein